MAETTNDYHFGMLSSDDVRTGFASGLTFKNKPVQYAVVDGLAIFEGDIVLGTVEEVEAHTAAVQSAKDTPEGVEFGVGITGQQFRWPNGRVPYTIDTALPNQNRVTAAVAHWQQNTNISFVLRTAAIAGQHPNWVHFRPATGCWSYVGMRGGKQDIGLAGGCGTGSTIHEICHAVGVWHEMSREDRDQHVSIQWQNIQAGREHNFNQHISDGDDYGSYDYGSIMHYPSHAFSKNGQPTIITIPPGIPIGQSNGLSSGDIATVHAMYQTWHNNMTVNRTYTSYHSQNAWAYLNTIGWRKIKTGKPDGVTNTFTALCEAKANNRNVHVLMDGTFIYRIQLV